MWLVERKATEATINGTRMKHCNADIQENSHNWKYITIRFQDVVGCRRVSNSQNTLQFCQGFAKNMRTVTIRGIVQLNYKIAVAKCSGTGAKSMHD